MGRMVCFQRCCCCVNLRTGGLMMGVMTLALSAFSIVPMALSLSKRTHLAQVVTHILNEYGKDGNQGPRELNMWGTVQDLLQNAATLPAEDDTKVVRLAAAMLIFFIVCIVLLLVYLVCSVMLMYGSVRGSRWLILLWLVATLLFIVAYCAGMVLSLAFLAIAIIESCIALYLWLCVISLFQHLADRQTNTQDWELKPRLNTSYKGLPSEER